MTDQLLEATGVSVTYGGVTANSEVSLRVGRGQCIGMIGANGAGKTSFIDAISGFTSVSSGVVAFEGRDITRLSPHDRAKLGLIRTFQSLELFEDLTVAENLQVACESSPWWKLPFAVLWHTATSDTEARVQKALHLLGLESLADRLPGELSHGHRKLVGIARALVGQPRLLLLDEPAAGLDSEETATLRVTLRQLVDRGLSLFLIDHDMGLVLSVCDEIYVLDFGSIIAHGDPASIRNNPAVIAAYLGESDSASGLNESELPAP